MEKFQKKHIDANLVECGIEVGVPNVGYQYTVIKDAVLHIVTNGEGTFKCQDVEHHLKEGDIFLLKKVKLLNTILRFPILGRIIGLAWVESKLSIISIVVKLLIITLSAMRILPILKQLFKMSVNYLNQLIHKTVRTF